MNNKLVSFCASHINTKQRINAFICMLNSYLEQTKKIEIYISISYNEIYKDIINTLIKNIRKKNSNINFIVSDIILSQFEHYKNLVNKVNIDQDSWLLFTDDDDIWKEDRVHYYNGIINKSISCNINPGYIKVNGTIEAIEEDTKLDIRTINHVNNLYVNGKTRYYSAENMNEFLDYYHYSVKLKTLKNFVDNVDIKILKHTYCDLCFCRYLHTGHSNTVINLQVDYGWLYFYRKCTLIGHVTLKHRNIKSIDDYIEGIVELYISKQGEELEIQNIKDIIKKKNKLKTSEMISMDKIIQDKIKKFSYMNILPKFIF